MQFAPKPVITKGHGVSAEASMARAEGHGVSAEASRAGDASDGDASDGDSSALLWWLLSVHVLAFAALFLLSRRLWLLGRRWARRWVRRLRRALVPPAGSQVGSVVARKGRALDDIIRGDEKVL